MSRPTRRAGRSQPAALSREVEAFLKVPFRRVANPFLPHEILNQEQLEKLHEASLEILENIGLDFLDDEALDIWAAAGARVDRGQRHVWLDRGLVLDSVARAPARFTLRGRNPARDMHVGDNVINFLPGGGMAYISDLEHGRRPGTRADYASLLKLVQMSNVMHGTGVALVEMMDLPVSHRHLHRVFLNFTVTDKPATGAAHDRIIPSDVVNMACLVFGEETGADLSRPVIAGIVNVNSPLRFDERMLGGLITYARAGQALIMTPFIIAGAMSPMTMAAAIAQQNAEVLAGVTLAQLIRPGTPVMYGGFCTNADMRSGSPAFGTPESAWVQIAGAQLARFYNLPCRGNGGLTNANLADAQAAAEGLWTLWSAVMGHTHYIMHAAGWLEAGLTISLEKMLIDMESLAVFQHYLEGFTINEDTLALDMMAAVGPGGHHFGTPHTQARFRTEYHEPFLHLRQSLDSWLSAGGEDTTRRAHRLWQALLRAYEPPPIDPSVEEALRDYVARRERELAGVELYY